MSQGAKLTGKRTRSNGLPPGILVDRQIRIAQERSLLRIEPFKDQFLEPATYDLRVGARAAVSTSPRPIDLEKAEWLVIEPGAMAIMQSLEILTLSDQIAGRLGPKTSLLRHGVMAATGPQVDPGYKGRLIVNLINLSPRSFSLRFGDPFLSIEFHYLNEKPERPYRGEYQERYGLSAEELEILLAYQGPTLAEIYRGFTELRDNIRDVAAIRSDLNRFTQQVQTGLENLPRRLFGLAWGSAGSVSVSELGEEGYTLLRPLTIHVHPEDDSFVASFFEASISATGDTDQDAIDNLLSLILDTFDLLTATPEPDLESLPRRQLNVLKTYVKKAG